MDDGIMITKPSVNVINLSALRLQFWIWEVEELRDKAESTSLLFVPTGVLRETVCVWWNKKR